MMCDRVQIINDDLANELDEQFSVSLISAVPTSVFRSSETCITIVDSDGETVDHADHNNAAWIPLISTLIFIVPEFSLSPLAVNATEGIDAEVQLCITISGSIARNVVVTAETASKPGATNQATG